GYSGAGDDDLLRRLEAMGYTRELTLGAGLATALDGSAARDLLRGRLVFPIRNEAGDIAGFAGRALDDAQPKYLNTPQTAVFDKGRILYAFDRAKDAIAAERRAVVVEGYMDVIAAHEHGFRNVVASMGTALTDAQIGLLSHRAETIVLALDADPAGQGSMFRGLLDLARRTAAVESQRQGLALRRAKVFDTFRVAALQDAKDPDDLIRGDPGRWRQAVEEAVPLADFLLDAAPRNLDLSTPAGKATAAESLRSVVAGVGWNERDRYVQRLAAMLEVEPETLRAALARSEAQPRAAARAPQPGGRVSEADFRQVKGDPLEERPLALVLRFADMSERLGELAVGHYQRAENLAVLSEMQAGGTIDEVRARLDSQSAEHLDRLLETDLPPMDFKQRSADFDVCVRRLEERALRQRKADEQLVFAETAAAGTPAPPEMEEQALAVNERLRQLFAASAKAP
ncbi:MAG: toprim domain-containing protein, partial [Chloroflexota bacterium]|nr:toprim domain-containing protein [Chloroflexota bacterium]